MNERIKKLAEQSGFYFYDLHDIDGQDLGETIEADNWESMERFAKLIIKECAEIALREDHEPYECILKHFGIEND